MPKNLNYELGVPSERTMPEFIQEDLLDGSAFYPIRFLLVASVPHI